MYAYSVTNKEDGSRYIGIAIDIKRRWYRHRWCARNGSRTLLHAAMRERGEHSFAFEVIAVALSWDHLLQLEAILIEQHETYFLGGRGYNMSLGGEGQRGYVPSPAHRERQRAAMLGQKRTAEQKARMGDAQRGRTFTAETRAKMSAVKKGKPGNGLGIKRSAETKERNRKAAAGRRHRPDSIAKMTGRTLSAEHKAKIIANLAKVADERRGVPKKAWTR